MKTLGLIGGLSWHSTIEYYTYINEAINDLNKNNTNPPLVVFNLNQRKIHDLQLKDDWDSIASILVDAALRLKSAGAEAVMFCANTPHKVYKQVQKEVSIPILHIADATGEAIKEKNLKKVGLIGTIYSMEGDFLKTWLKEKHNIDVLVPTDESDRKELHRIIQEELTMGVFKEESKKYILSEIEKLEANGAEGIILGCTEFPLIIKESDLNIPSFNTTYLHAMAGVKFILDK
jgi:aspartate racemase